jgi:hypothetical protein
MEKATHSVKVRRKRHHRSQAEISRDVAQLRAWAADQKRLDFSLHREGCKVMYSGTVCELRMELSDELAQFLFIGHGLRVMLLPSAWTGSELNNIAGEACLAVSERKGNGFSIAESSHANASMFTDVVVQLKTWMKLKAELCVLRHDGAFIHAILGSVYANEQSPDLFTFGTPGVPDVMTVDLRECSHAWLSVGDDAKTVSLLDRQWGQLLQISDTVIRPGFPYRSVGTAQTFPALGELSADRSYSE